MDLMNQIAEVMNQNAPAAAAAAATPRRGRKAFAKDEKGNAKVDAATGRRVYEDGTLEEPKELPMLFVIREGEGMVPTGHRCAEAGIVTANHDCAFAFQQDDLLWIPGADCLYTVTVASGRYAGKGTAIIAVPLPKG